MPNERISMSKLKQLIGLQSSNLSVRALSRFCCIKGGDLKFRLCRLPKRRCAPMLSLKSFRTAAITLAGVELAHRIRKGQFSLRPGATPELSSFKDLWTHALKRRDASRLSRSDGPQPPMQQNSPYRLLSEQDVRSIEPARRARKITVGRCLYLNVTPTGGRSWHYKFYFDGKCKKLMLGTYPEISLECAKSRH
jgi:hypothetical protein